MIASPVGGRIPSGAFARLLMQGLAPITLWTLVFGLAEFGTLCASTIAFPNGVAAGEVTTSSALLWTRAVHTGPVRFEVSTHADFGQIQMESTVNSTDPDVPVKAEIQGLLPGVEYHYRVLDAQGSSATGRFRTPNSPESFHGLRFGVSGDWRGDLAPYPAVANAAARNLDFFAGLGDIIYADHPSPAVPGKPAHTLAEYRAKYQEAYSAHFGMNALGDLRASTAFFAVGNDHEVVNDYAGGAAPASDARFAGTAGAFINESDLYKTGMQAFEEYNPLHPARYETPGDPRTHQKPKFYRHQTYGKDAAIFLLDTRSFRDAPLAEVSNPLDNEAINRFHSLSFDIDPTTKQSLPKRTLLSEVQLAELKADLLKANTEGILWKMILLGEPIQNLGFIGGSDRFEGYARERTELLKFIVDHRIQNVVFITADLHGTVVNNINFQNAPGQPTVPTGSFEIVTGPVAYDKPLGPEAFDVAAGVQILGFNLLQALLEYVEVPNRAAFEAMPLIERDRVFKSIMDVQLTAIELDSIGLENSDVNATLQQGQYVSAHTYGWSEFEIASAPPHALTVTTYGITPYSTNHVDASITNRVPEIVSRFVVQPRTGGPAGPVVAVGKSGTDLEISWPAGQPEFVLQSRTTVTGANWVDATETPTLTEGRHRAVIKPAEWARFFRLHAR